MRVRAGARSDGPAGGELFVRARAHSLAFLPLVHPDDEAREHFATVVFGGPTIVAEDDTGALLGFAALGPPTDHGPDGPLDPLPWLAHLYVDPPAHGQGVGRALLAAVREQLPDGFRLWVFQRNARARTFYARNGCVEELATDGAGNEEREPDVRMVWRPAAPAGPDAQPGAGARIAGTSPVS